MTTPDQPIMLDLDPSGYIQGLGQAEQATQQFGGTLRSTAATVPLMQRAMSAVTPTRAALATMTGFTAVAALQQQQLSGLAASSAVTGASYGRLTTGIRQLARELPVGNAGARDMVQTITKLGVVSAGSEKPLNTVSRGVAAFNKSTLASAGPGSGLEKLSNRVDDLFGTRGKLTSSGTERRVTELSRSFLKLGGATSEAPAQLASGVIQLNRAMGTGMNVQRVNALNDSLTTTAAMSGASATGVLSFAKAIAPMARDAGIGQTQVLGISSAFAKLGDDGFAGANAFSKMMSDLNRSVREGTPQMAAYAQIAGRTTKEFEALYRANPAEALTQVVESIGTSGNAPRLLEQIGLEGVRTARVLTNLSQAGDLRGSISTAVNAYGNNSTQRASETAFGGLNDSLQRLTTNSEQTAQAIGTPLLGAVTMLTNGLGAVLSPVRALAESGPAQAVGTAAAYGALPLLAGLKLLGPALTSAGVFQLGTSGPVRGLLGGYAAAGGPGGRLAGRLGGNSYNDLVAEGRPVGVGRMLGVNERAAELGAGLGRAMQGTIVGNGGAGILRQVGGGVVGAGALYGRLMSEQLRMARVPFDQREGSYRPDGDPYRRVMENTANLRGQFSAGNIDRAGLTTGLQREFQNLTGTIGTTRNALMTLGRSSLAVAGQGMASGAVMAGRGLMRGAGALAGAFGGPVGLALTAGLGGYMAYSSSKRNSEEMIDTQRNATSWIDDYRVAMGKATDATSTFAGRLTEAANSAANAPVTARGARAVTQSEMDRALADQSPQVRDYGRDPRAAANMLRLQAGTSGIAPDEMQRVQQDLFKSGFGLNQVRDIMRQLPNNLVASGSRSSVRDIRSVVGDLAGAPLDNGTLGWRSLLDPTLGMNEGSKGSSPLGIDALSKTTKRGAQDLTVSIRDRAAERSATYGAEYATSQMITEMDAAIGAAMKSGNIDLQRNLAERFQAELGIEDTFRISTADLRRSGGFSDVLRREDQGFREGAWATAQQARGPQRRENWAAEQIGADNPLQSWFSSRGPLNGIQRAVQGLIGPQGTPSSPQLQTSTMQAAMSEAQRAGMSMGELARNSLEAANAIGNTADASHQFAMALNQAAVAQETRQGNFQSSADYALTRSARFSAQAALSPNDEATQAAQQAGVAGLQQVEAEAVQRARARLTQQREFQVQSVRMQEDYERQQVYAEQDYERSVSRGRADFQRQMLRGEEDFGIQMTRASEQQALSMRRAEEDYQTSVRDAQQDFNRQRVFAARDFAKSMRRAAEDGARAMYEPYQRIQVKPTWDAGNLLGNLREQNEAISRQMQNLSRLRQGGVGSNAIKLLGLNDPNNAQQLAQIVSDMASSPQVVQALNTAATQRRSLGMALSSDPDNTERQRAAEDFQEQSRRSEQDFERGMRRQERNFRRQLARAGTDFRTTMSHMGADHRRAMNRATADQQISLDRAAQDRQRALARTQEQYSIAVRRMRQDIRRADQEIVGDLRSLTNAMNRAVSGQFVNFQRLTTNGMQGWSEVLRRFQREYAAATAGMATPNFTTGAGSSNSSAPASARGAERGSRGRGGGGYGVLDVGWQSSPFGRRNGRLHAGVDIAVPVGTPVKAYRDGVVAVAGSAGAYGTAVYLNHGEGRSTRYGHLSALGVRPGQSVRQGQVIARSGNTGRSTGPHLHFETRINGVALNPAVRTFAVGGIATRPVQGLIAEKGDAEGIIPLNSGGAQFMADMMKRWIKASDVRGIQAASGTTYVTYDSSTTTHDNRVVIEKVELKADSPRELAAAAAAKARRDNLTAPPQRRR